MGVWSEGLLFLSMKEIIYISGGQRSGKSGFAQRLALSLSPTPVYLATAQHWDADFDKRIARHQADRGPQWTNVEELRYISQVPHLSGRVVLMDCVTLWLTNIYSDLQYDADKALTEAKAEWDRFIAQDDVTLIVVSNEIGMGVHATAPATRAFVDLQGFMNQYVAGTAHTAYFMVSGIPMLIKGNAHTIV